MHGVRRAAAWFAMLPAMPAAWSALLVPESMGGSMGRLPHGHEHDAHGGLGALWIMGAGGWRP